MENKAILNHKNHGIQSHSSTDPLFEPLHRASTAINMCITRDENYPEIGDILTRLMTEKYF